MIRIAAILLSALAAPLSASAAPPVGAPAQIPSSPATVASDIAPGQISSPSQSSTQTSQIAPPHSGPASAPQVSGPVNGPAVIHQPQLTQGQGNAVAVAPANGHDRCDPAASRDSARSAECAEILDNRSAQFKSASEPSAAAISPDQPSDLLVNGIVSGGTGTVVALPAPK